MVELMAADGIPVTIEEVRAQAGADTTMGRPHIADALVASGFVRTRDEAFTDVLRNGSRYYVSHYAPDPVLAVQLVREAGGVPVMAHPFANGRGWTVDDSVIEEMAAVGLAGLEAYHRDHRAGRGAPCRGARGAAGAVRDRLERLPRCGQGEPARREHHCRNGARADRGQATSGIDVVRVGRA